MEVVVVKEVVVDCTWKVYIYQKEDKTRNFPYFDFVYLKVEMKTQETACSIVETERYF